MCGEGPGVGKGSVEELVTLSEASLVERDDVSTCSMAQSRTIPSRSDDEGLAALLNRSTNPFVAGLGSSKRISKPYFRLVASRNSNSFLVLFTAEHRRSRERKVESRWRLAVSGMRILPISDPVNETRPREMKAICASH